MMALSLLEPVWADTFRWSMSIAPIKVFRDGKGTTTRLEFTGGQSRHTLTRTGMGSFLPQTFASLEDAANFCSSELLKDHSAVLYIMEGDLILKTVLDHAFQQAKAHAAARKYAVLSTAVFTGLGFAIISTMSPFATGPNLALLSGTVLFYVLLLLFFGARNFEAALTMTIFLVLLCLILPALKHARERSQIMQRSLIIPLPDTQTPSPQFNAAFSQLNCGSTGSYPFTYFHNDNAALNASK